MHQHRPAGQRVSSKPTTTASCPESSAVTDAWTCSVDELGYVQIDPRGTDLLFQIITEREERASIAIATNLPFS